MSDDDLIAQLEEHERRLVFDRFDYDDAWALGSLLVGLGVGRGLPIAVDIRRPSPMLSGIGPTPSAPSLFLSGSAGYPRLRQASVNADVNSGARSAASRRTVIGPADP